MAMVSLSPVIKQPDREESNGLTTCAAHLWILRMHPLARFTPAEPAG
jgi:hypothetical protein